MNDRLPDFSVIANVTFLVLTLKSCDIRRQLMFRTQGWRHLFFTACIALKSRPIHSVVSTLGIAMITYSIHKNGDSMLRAFMELLFDDEPVVVMAARGSE